MIKEWEIIEDMQTQDKGLEAYCRFLNDEAGALEAALSSVAPNETNVQTNQRLHASFASNVTQGQREQEQQGQEQDSQTAGLPGQISAELVFRDENGVLLIRGQGGFCPVCDCGRGGKKDHNRGGVRPHAQTNAAIKRE
jgi:hypothetical protein